MLDHFFQLLQVSIKLAADSSMEKGAVGRRKPKPTLVPPPHSFSQEGKQLGGGQGNPAQCQGLSGARDPPDGHKHQEAFAATKPRPAPVQLLLSLPWNLLLFEESEEK